MTIARSEWPYTKATGSKVTEFALVSTSVFTPSKDGDTARWLSGSCSNADIFPSSSPHLRGGRSALGPLVRLTEGVKRVHIISDSGGS